MEFSWEISNGPELGDSEEYLIANIEWTPAQWFWRFFGWKLWWWRARVIIWSFGWAVRKDVFLSQTDGSRVMECVDRVLGGIGGQQASQRCKNHGCWLCTWRFPLWRMRYVVGCRPYILASATSWWPWSCSPRLCKCEYPWICQSRESVSQCILGKIRVWPRPPNRSRPWGMWWCPRLWRSGAPGWSQNSFWSGWRPGTHDPACGGRSWIPLGPGRQLDNLIWSERWYCPKLCHFGCPKQGRYGCRIGSDQLGRRWGEAGPQRRKLIPGGAGIGMYWGVKCTWCTRMIWGKSRSSVGAGQQHRGIWGWKQGLLQKQWIGRYQGGWPSLA